MPFPPVPTYPKALDTDRTLFLVYNTTETRLCEDNDGWSDSISILPVAADEDEIWGLNGFATVSGEILYYDGVVLNSDGKVSQLTGCARNLGGSRTQFNPRGTWIRGFVMAEHHNQLVRCILASENFIGYNFDVRQFTLDWRIRHLQALPIIDDDFNCPDIDFEFSILSTDPQTGITAQYSITSTPPGTIGSFTLDFGDGQSTTTSTSGTHVYSATATIDPILTISNGQCQSILSPATRTSTVEPTAVTPTPLDFPFPEVPPVPPFTCISPAFQPPDLTIPPIVTPCVSVVPAISPNISGSFSIPSVVTFLGISYPINITQSVVSIVSNLPTIPSVIYHDIPPTIVIEPPIPPTIVIIASTASSGLTMGLDWTDVPDLKMDWSEMPEMKVALSYPQRAVSKHTGGSPNEFGAEFADLFEAGRQMVEYEPIDIPREIKVIPPEMPHVVVDASNIPRTIEVDTKGVTIPTKIEFVGMTEIPRQIEVVGKPIAIDTSSLPRQIEIVGPKIPDKIEVRMENPIPDVIKVESTIPDRIYLDSSQSQGISVKGIPDHIEVRGIPDLLEIKADPIQLLAPESLPKVELRITMDETLKAAANDGAACVMIIPCPR